LEKHIKTSHADYKTYDCNNCEKKFVTIWRLGKHDNLHLNIQTKPCKYFINKTKCPFDDLGCKFRHDTETQESIKTINNSLELSEYTFNMLSTINPTASNETSSFYASTPKKCEECADKSKCDDCIVNHIIGQH